MLKRKKPRQNSASTSPSSSPPNSGLAGISLPSDISLNQQKQSQLQDNNNNINNNTNNSSSQEIQQDNNNNNNQKDSNNSGSSGKNHKNKKKKNKSRDRKSSSPTKSSTPITTTTSVSLGSTASTPLPINNSSNNNKDNSNNSYSKSPSYPKKYQKPNSPNSTPIEVLTSKPKLYQKIESSSDFDQQIKKEEISKEGQQPMEKIAESQISASSSPLIQQEQPISLHESLKMSRQPTTTITSEQNFVPLNLGDDKKFTPTTTIIPSQSETNKSFVPINNNINNHSHNNNTLHNNSYNNHNNINFSYNNTTFNFSKNKYHHNNRRNSEKLPTHIPLWLQGHGYSGRDLQSITLNREIELFCQWLEPNEYELRIRQKIIREIESIVKNNWPKAKVVVFGSFSSNLFIPSSDIDIQISDINEGIDRYSFQNPIRDFHSLLIKNHQNSFCNVRLISGAKIPIIKMTSVHTQYNIDICFDTPSGIENTQVVKSFLKEYKSMRILLLVLKFFLHQNNLNETYTGGIGSYALALMVVSYIQLRHVPPNHKITPHSKARKEYKHAGDATDYGLMLIEFFELYGRIFNYSVHGISLEHGGYYFKKDEIKALGAGLTLIDPHDSENDVGKNSFNIPFIRGVFCSSFLKLLSHDMIKEQYGRFNFPTLLSRVIEERLVEQFARQRANVVKYASQLDESGLLPELISIDDLLVKTPPNSEVFINNKQLKNNSNNSISSSNNSLDNSIKEKEKLNNNCSVINIGSSDEEEELSIISKNNRNGSSSNKDKIISSGGSCANGNSSNSIKIIDKKIIKEDQNNINSNSSSGEEFSEDSNQSQNESSDVHSSDSSFSSSSEYSDSEFEGSNSCSSDNIHEDDSDGGGSSKNNNSTQKLVDPIGFEW